MMEEKIRVRFQEALSNRMLQADKLSSPNKTLSVSPEGKKLS
jgi:hypothetical protein